MTNASFEPVRKVLLTGAAGRVGTLVLRHLAQSRANLTATDRMLPAGVGQGAIQWLAADLADPVAASELVQGHDAIVHLAGVAHEASVDALYRDNTLALANLLRAAVDCRATRFVFASTMHVLGLYSRHESVDEQSPPRPDSHYAASKLHGEALCRLYAEKTGLVVTVLRLGHVCATLEEAEPACWIAPEDVAQLIEIGLTRNGPAFELFHAIADYSGSPLAPSRARGYGYECRRRAESYGEALQRLRRWTSTPLALERRGATHASAAL